MIMATSVRSVPRPVAGFVLAMVIALGAACVGGPGSVPDQVIGGEGASSNAEQGGSSSGDAKGSSSGSKTGSTSTATPTAPTAAPTPTPTTTGSAGGCVEGSPCDCGSTKFVGTYKCVDGKPTCNCVPVP